MLSLNIALSLATAYAMAVAFFFVLNVNAVTRTVVLVALSSGMLACPFWIPEWCLLARGVVAGFVSLFVIKTWDVHLSIGRQRRFGLGTYSAFLLNFTWFVWEAANGRFDRLLAENRLTYLLKWLVGFVAATAVLFFVFSVEWAEYGFLIEHWAKATTITVWLLCGFNLHGAKWRLAGVTAFHTEGDVLIAGTPAEFWRKWNRPVGQWFHRHVFRSAGGAKRPFFATLMTFAVSGIAHEYVVAMFAGVLTGYAFAFYVLQGLAVAVTFRLRPIGWTLVPAIAVTWAFMVLSSVLLFAPFNTSMQFYVNDVPGWIGAPVKTAPVHGLESQPSTSTIKVQPMTHHARRRWRRSSSRSMFILTCQQAILPITPSFGFTLNQEMRLLGFFVQHHGLCVLLLMS